MSEAVSIETCNVRHEGVTSRIEHIEDHGKELQKKYDKALWLLIANLGGVIVLLVKTFV